MCGRAAQTYQSVQAAANALMGGAGNNSNSSNSRSYSASAPNQQQQGEQTLYKTDKQRSNSNTTEDHEEEAVDKTHNKDNYNMSPGMKAHVFIWDQDSQTMEQKESTWGLLSSRHANNENSSSNSSLALHFSSNMFNARSDTLFEKFTYSKLLARKQTCLIAIQGFFEWKAPTGIISKKKQPYYVHRKISKEEYNNAQDFLLLAGLYDDSNDTFTIVTTDACSCLLWLHSRMPLVIWDLALALQWLQGPSRVLLKQMEQSAWSLVSTDHLAWHAVTTKMNSLSYRDPSAIVPIKQPPSVKSFFAPKTTKQPTTSINTTTKKEPTKIDKKRSSNQSSPPVANKKLKASTTSSSEKKMGSISSFFSPKSSKT